MAVAIATSTNGKFTTFSSENATLATALSEVLNELDTQNKSLTKTNSTANKYALVSIVKN